jgi:hypothetical protein
MVQLMKKLITLMLFYAPQIFADQCIFDERGTHKVIGSITSQLSMLKTWQMEINLKKPKQDAVKRLKVGDFRLLAMATNPYYPIPKGYLKAIDEKTVCLLGERFIEGLGSVELGEWAALADKFFDYAAIYNMTILDNWEVYSLKIREKEALNQAFRDQGGRDL